LKAFNAGILPEYGVDDIALHSNTPSVNDADLPKAKAGGLIHILFHTHLDISRMKAMKVDGVADWDFVHRSRI